MPEPVVGDWSRDDTGPAAFVRQRQRGGYDLLSPSVVTAARAAYYGLVTHIDYALGRVLAALQDVDLLASTTILFTSDHGEFLGDHRSGNKVMFHDVSARVPLLYRPPDKARAGETSDALVTHTDVAASILAEAGGERPQDWDGTDLGALLRGDVPRREHLLGVAHDDPAGPPIHLSVVTNGWKYLWYPEGGREQLFDLSADPDETDDLAARDPAQARAMRQLVAAELTAADSPWVTEGALVEVPLRGDSERERRAHGWPGLHTETYHLDVRH